MNIETALKEAMTIDGAVGTSLVDWDSGMSLGALGGGKYLDLDVRRRQHRGHPSQDADNGVTSPR